MEEKTTGRKRMTDVIDIYVNEIRRALRHQCYFPALALALALPDICGMAEFPGLNVTDRYIAWYDKYLGSSTAQSGQFDDTPYLSGEMVYNLRNTYLHKGSPSVQRDKVREEVNQIEKFILVLGDGAGFRETSFSMRMSSAETGIVYLRRIYVEVTYLCNTLCDGALQYYKRNREKFRFDFSILPQEALLGEDSPLTAAARMGDRMVGLGMRNSFGRKDSSGNPENSEEPQSGGQSQKDEQADNSVRKDGQALKDSPVQNDGQSRKDSPPKKDAQSQEDSPPKKDAQSQEDNPPKKDAQSQEDSPPQKDGQSSKNEKPEPRGKASGSVENGEKNRGVPVDRETQRLRCFFGEHFKEEKFREKRDEIIAAVLSAKSKQQLNGTLMKLFPGEDVKAIFQRLDPQLKDLPPSDQKKGQPEQEKKPDTAAENAGPSGKESGAKETPTKKERKIRGFFEGNFAEKKYQEKKEEIIQAVLSAKSKQQLNSFLTKLFPGEDVKVILKRFKELIKDLPGR